MTELPNEPENHTPPRVPRIGEMVLYHYAGPFFRGAGEPHPAVVVSINEDGTLNLTEFREGCVEHRRRVRYSEREMPFSWRFPE